jgi:flagellar basal body-associated protein FliL
MPKRRRKYGLGKLVGVIIAVIIVIALVTGGYIYYRNSMNAVPSSTTQNTQSSTAGQSSYT